MAWTSPVTFVSGQVVGASDMNTQVRDNFNYLFSSRPAGSVAYVNGANYTTTSTTAVDIDAAHVALTLVISSTRVFVMGMAMLNATNVASQAAFIQCYSSGLNAVGGNQALAGPNATAWVVCGAIFTGLTPGSQTFKLRFGVTNPAITATIKCLEGVNGWYPVVLHAWEF